MTKTNVKVSVPLEEYNELIKYKRIAEKLTAYVDGLGVSTTEKVKVFNVGDRVKIVGPTWVGTTFGLGLAGTICVEADADGDYDVNVIGSDGYREGYPPSSLELI